MAGSEGRAAHFFHGTTFDIEGGVVRPARESKKSIWKLTGHSGQMSNEHAFATTDEDTAWQFASQGGYMKRAAGTKTDRVRVHTVDPHPDMQPGVFNSEHPSYNSEYDDLAEFVAPHFKVNGRLDIMPGRQGTFPSLNWHQFKSDRLNASHDVNHPSDAEVEHGHVGAYQRGMGLHQDRAADFKPEVDEHQMDLFSGRTVGDHAENDENDIGDYHRNRLFGTL